ncbi:MAG: hypothetical protein ACREPV_06175 [Lysobacter sp.]
MSIAKSPVEQRFDLLCELWMEAVADPAVRLVVWRIPGNAGRMLDAFFEAHKQSPQAMTPDYFLRFDTAFETGFGYSRALADALQTGYIGSRDKLKAQGLPINWRDAHLDAPASAAGTLQLMRSFGDYYHEHLRHFVAVLVPSTVSRADALEAWLDAALRTPVPERLRVALVDFDDGPQWSALAARHGAAVRVIEAPIDMFDIARATAAQSSGGAGPSTAYRQVLTDVMTLLEKGRAAQVARRAERGLAMCERERWPDQQVVLHMAVAGAHMKEQQHPEAIGRYRAARESAQTAQLAGHPAGPNLLMQTWFGEAGAWLNARQPARAAEAYAAGSAAAKAIPNGLFAIEGLRMAGFCHAQGGHKERAREHYLFGLGEAKAMPAADRPLTTLPLLLQDMLRLQDPARVVQLEECASRYQAQVTDAQTRAESRAAKLGANPVSTDVDGIEAELVAAYEAAFQRLLDEREQLIARGDDYFRKVVAVAREYLHPRWNGLPEVKHPLDKSPEQFSRPPSFAELPDPAELLQSAAVPAEAVCAPVEAFA